MPVLPLRGCAGICASCGLPIATFCRASNFSQRISDEFAAHYSGRDVKHEDQSLDFFGSNCRLVYQAGKLGRFVYLGKSGGGIELSAELSAHLPTNLSQLRFVL